MTADQILVAAASIRATREIEGRTNAAQIMLGEYGRTQRMLTKGEAQCIHDALLSYHAGILEDMGVTR